MDNYGNFGKRYVREIIIKDEDGKDVCIKLKYTAQTLLLYMNYFHTDMFDDLAKISANQMPKHEIYQKIEENGIDSIEEDELTSISTDETLIFFDKFAVALVATALYPESVSYERIRTTMLPEDFITDERYVKLFEAIQELFTPVLADYKKKLIRVMSKAQKR